MSLFFDLFFLPPSFSTSYLLNINNVRQIDRKLCYLNFKSAHLLMDLNLKHAHPIFLRGYSLKLNGRFRLCLNYTNGLLQIR